jgi:hypothetical protein|tara:strand:+ start:6917 stop:7309 length:393 start_codon:yes stop_codon:yes gene_type:complete
MAHQAELMGWWQNQHGRQLRIAATGTFASTLITVVSALQLMILQDISAYEEYTGAAIVMLVLGITGLAICAPPFASLKGNSNTIKEIMELTSSSELRRMRPEGDEAAELLGGGHAEAWKAFLIEKGLKKR